MLWVLGLHLGDVHTDHRLQALLPNLTGHQGMPLLRQHGHIAHHFVEHGTACVHVRPHLGKLVGQTALIAKEQQFVTARVSDASLLLEVAVLLHLFRVVAKVEHLDGEDVLGQDLPQLPVVFIRAPPEHPQHVPPRVHERREGLDVPFEVPLVQRRLAVGEGLPLEDATQPRIFYIVETHYWCFCR